MRALAASKGSDLDTIPQPKSNVPTVKSNQHHQTGKLEPLKRLPSTKLATGALAKQKSKIDVPRFCPWCGAGTKPTYKFCMSCGAAKWEPEKEHRTRSTRL
mmetsp:Transcript_88066/g.137939  ORF Transcript_88066/g.137939 Transcript_88066/m.137939 type:complete len:101 (-) Transcript_88066:96-398(-)